MRRQAPREAWRRRHPVTIGDFADVGGGGTLPTDRHRLQHAVGAAHAGGPGAVGAQRRRRPDRRGHVPDRDVRPRPSPLRSRAAGPGGPSSPVMSCSTYPSTTPRTSGSARSLPRSRTAAGSRCSRWSSDTSGPPSSTFMAELASLRLRERWGGMEARTLRAHRLGHLGIRAGANLRPTMPLPATVRPDFCPGQRRITRRRKSRPRHPR